MNNSPAGERLRSGPAGHGCVKRGSEKDLQPGANVAKTRGPYQELQSGSTRLVEILSISQSRQAESSVVVRPDSP
jgi:hypothetical protein